MHETWCAKSQKRRNPPRPPAQASWRLPQAVFGVHFPPPSPARLILLHFLSSGTFTFCCFSVFRRFPPCSPTPSYPPPAYSTHLQPPFLFSLPLPASPPHPFFLPPPPPHLPCSPPPPPPHASLPCPALSGTSLAQVTGR